MDRSNFNKMIIDDLLLIVYDEIEYLHHTDPSWTIKSPLEVKDINVIKKLKSGEIEQKEADVCYKSISDQIEHELRELYYFYDHHKLSCKEYLGNHAIDLDRHKLSVVFLCALISYGPIKFVNIRKREYPSQDLVLANYRVAFRFACSYASRALYNSFMVRKDEFEGKLKEVSNDDKEELNRKVKMYSEAMSKLESQGSLFFPATRDGLDKYVDNLIKVLYLQFDDTGEEDVVPYALLADTFYWLDVYTKIKLGVEVEEEKYPKGLRRN